MTPHSQKLAAVGANGFQLVAEPLEGAFTILLPEGWTHRVHLQREHALNRVIASAESPDRGTRIFVGDARLPMFQKPSPFLDPQLLAFSPHICLQPYTPADHFLTDYARRFFGGAPDFRIVGVGPSERLRQLTLADLRRGGHPATVTGAAVRFEHRGDGPLARCEVHGVTVDIGAMWYADLYGCSTTGDAASAAELAARMMTSRQFDRGWSAGQQRLHEQRMANGRQQLQHIEAMTALQRQGHEQRMHDIRQAGAQNTRMHEERMSQMDASHAGWMDQQGRLDAQHRSRMSQEAQGDAAQRARVDGIREEHTVVDASGATYKVDMHHERYFVNKRDGTYIGAGSATEQADLRRTLGVNPDDYEEVRIVRS